MMNLDPRVVAGLDWSLFANGIAAFFGWMPAVSALFSVVWLGLRIWESDTVKEWRGKKPLPTHTEGVLGVLDQDHAKRPEK